MKFIVRICVWLSSMKFHVLCSNIFQAFQKRWGFYLSSYLEMIKKSNHQIKILQYLSYQCGTLICSQLYYIDSILFVMFLFLIWIFYFVTPLHSKDGCMWMQIFNAELQQLFDVNIFCLAVHPFIWPRRISQNSLINGIFKKCWACIHVLEREELIMKICSLKKGSE